MITDYAKYEIIPGILEKEWGAIEKKIELVRPFAKSLHIDLLDGKFAPNTSFLDPKPFEKYAKDFTLELHMMVDNPLQYVDSFAAAGFKRFLGHIEKMPDQAAFVEMVQQFAEVGLALDGDTPLDALKVPLIDLDTVLLMTIKAGFSGQKFMPDKLEKIHALHEKDGALLIEIDGGVNLETLPQAVASGVSRAVSTSCLFGAEDLEKQFRLLEQCFLTPETP